jgi:hypothetical protein
MRTVLAIAAFVPLLFAAASCGDDDGGGADDEAACLAACEAAHAEELAECDYCGVEIVFEDGQCISCTSISCVSDLCDAWCEETDAGVSGTCYLDSCTCP